MDQFPGILANGALLPNPLDGSCVEMGSSNANVHRNRDAGLDNDGDPVRDAERHRHDLMLHGEEDVLYEHGDDANLEDTRMKKKYKTARSWRDEWQQLYPWACVKLVNGEERMFCTICESHGNPATRNAFRKDGSCNFQASALASHANCSVHKNALLVQKAWTEAGKMGIISKGRGKVPVVTEYGVIANHLANMASRLNTVVTRDDLNVLTAEWRIAQRCKDARRINSCCALTDPLVPVPTLDGVVPDGLPNSLAELVALSVEHIEALLTAYELPVHGSVDAKLRRLKAHLGFYQ